MGVPMRSRGTSFEGMLGRTVKDICNPEEIFYMKEVQQLLEVKVKARYLKHLHKVKKADTFNLL